MFARGFNELSQMSTQGCGAFCMGMLLGANFAPDTPGIEAVPMVFYIALPLLRRNEPEFVVLKYFVFGLGYALGLLADINDVLQYDSAPDLTSFRRA